MTFHAISGLLVGLFVTTSTLTAAAGPAGLAATGSVAPDDGSLVVMVDTPAAMARNRQPFSDLIARYAKANKVPLDLAHAVVYSESSYRPNARGAAGEIGLMQLRLSTARMMGYRGSAKGLYDPATNIRYGMKYLGGAHRLAGGSTCGTILRYNAGHGATRMNPVSRRYCNKVNRLLSN